MKTAAVFVVALLIAANLTACKPQTPSVAEPAATPKPVAREVAPVLLTEDALDIHSYAQPAIARVTHVDLDLTADFTAHTLAGTAVLDVQTAAHGNTLTLDTNGLTIESVTDQAGKALAWTLGTVDKVLGAPLRIEMLECINCDACLRHCPPTFGAIFNHGPDVIIVPELCSGCDKCLPACPVDCIYPDPDWTPAPDGWWELPLSRLDPYK